MNIEAIVKVGEQLGIEVVKHKVRARDQYYVHVSGQSKNQKYLGTLETLAKLSKEQLVERIEKKLADMAATSEKKRARSEQDQSAQPALEIEHKIVELVCNLDGRRISQTVNAYVCGGLALHESLTGSGRTITHVKDGVYIYRNIGKSMKYLLGIIQEMASLTDWNRPYHEVANDLVSNPELREKYEALLGKLAPGKEPSILHRKY